ncbi:iron-containing alcohol dehydrogenase [Aquamicrobium sp. LC103]|uniref:iron-containing alcohol dehydrogenase family protein n=1 Tax=Aquamicrobium sp. LC103 TaxID=1120658 RepID=UPI00148501E4|nr:iron-containing alcohol dehydrogenase [Aquamicrobium sp. LC103]
MTKFSPDDFTYLNTGTKVVMKAGAADLIETELERLGCRKVMVITGPSASRSAAFGEISAALGHRLVSVVSDIPAHTPEDFVMRSADEARSRGIDGLLAFGGGSASDCAKAIAIVLAEGGSISEHSSSFTPPDDFRPKELHQPKLPIIAVPTTASAAEVTPGLGVRGADGRKMLFWDVKLCPRLIVLDPEANLEVPSRVMAETGMNALAHCVEGLYSRLRNPISEAIAHQGLKMLASGLPAMVAEPDNTNHRARVLAGAHLSGMVISNARVGIHHAICHCLGAHAGLGHGESNSIMLPYAMAFNGDAAAGEFVEMAVSLGAERTTAINNPTDIAVERVRALQRVIGVPSRLRDTKIERRALPHVAAQTLLDRGVFFNPRRVETAEPILDILEAAW